MMQIDQDFLQKYTPYWIVLMAALMACYYIYTWLRKGKRVVRRVAGAISGPKYNSNSGLSPEEKRAVSVSAIYSVQQAAFVDSLETGLPKSEYNHILSEWWGIENESDARGQLNSLNEEAYNYFFPSIYKALSQDELPIEDYLKSQFSVHKDYIKALELAVNLKECIRELKADNVIDTVEDLSSFGPGAWDYGRLVFVARLCFDAGYLNQEEAMKIINDAYKKAKSNYSNWEDFAKSYVIGRAMWGGINSSNNGITSIAQDLLNDVESPWLRHDLL